MLSSILGHPFVVLPASIGALAVLRGGDLRTALALAVVFVVVSLAVVLGVRAARFNDFDVSQRERRPGFLVRWRRTGGAAPSQRR